MRCYKRKFRKAKYSYMSKYIKKRGKTTVFNEHYVINKFQEFYPPTDSIRNFNQREIISRINSAVPELLSQNHRIEKFKQRFQYF